MRYALLTLVLGLAIGMAIVETAAAPNGDRRFDLESETSASNSDSSKEVTVSCPTGTIVSGGGADIDGGGKQVAVRTSQPTNQQAQGLTAWRAVAFETDPRDQDWTVEAFAICTEAPEVT